MGHPQSSLDVVHDSTSRFSEQEVGVEVLNILKASLDQPFQLTFLLARLDSINLYFLFVS